jgi:dTDP-4-dehydrorhamnose 3,5-epimerase
MVGETGIKGLIVYTPKSYADERGSFRETYNQQTWSAAGVDIDFIQDNVSISHEGVLRGLHFQTGEYAQTKLVRVAVGRAMVAVVDLRANTDTWGKVFQIELTASNETQLLVPKGFAHGFMSLEDNTQYVYKVDGYRVPESESGLNAMDPELGINWGLPADKILRKQADVDWPNLSEIKIRLR